MNFPGGAFEGVEDQESPFGYGRGEGVDAGHGDPEWICSKEKPRYDQLFQSLNPIDGKVTGAGTNVSTLAFARLLIAHPHLRATLVIDKALQVLLSSTEHCSQLTELCMIIKTNENRIEPGAGDFDKIATILATSTQIMNGIAQFVTDNVRDESHDISSVSIHTLNDIFLDDASRHNISATSTPILGKSSNFESDDPSEKFDNETESYDRDARLLNLDVPKEGRSFFEHVLLSTKLIFLLFINMISIIIIIHLLFTSTVYILTGNMVLEFKVEKAPESWLDKATVAAFGSKEEIVQIHNFFELFYKHNLMKLLKYFIIYF